MRKFLQKKLDSSRVLRPHATDIWIIGNDQLVAIEWKVSQKYITSKFTVELFCEDELVYVIAEGIPAVQGRYAMYGYKLPTSLRSADCYTVRLHDPIHQLEVTSVRFAVTSPEDASTFEHPVAVPRTPKVGSAPDSGGGFLDEGGANGKSPHHGFFGSGGGADNTRSLRLSVHSDNHSNPSSTSLPPTPASHQQNIPPQSLTPLPLQFQNSLSGVSPPGTPGPQGRDGYESGEDSGSDQKSLLSDDVDHPSGSGGLGSGRQSREGTTFAGAPDGEGGPLLPPPNPPPKSPITPHPPSLPRSRSDPDLLKKEGKKQAPKSRLLGVAGRFTAGGGGVKDQEQIDRENELKANFANALAELYQHLAVPNGDSNFEYVQATRKRFEKLLLEAQSALLAQEKKDLECTEQLKEYEVEVGLLDMKCNICEELRRMESFPEEVGLQGLLQEKLAAGLTEVFEECKTSYFVWCRERLMGEQREIACRDFEAKLRTRIKTEEEEAAPHMKWKTVEELTAGLCDLAEERMKKKLLHDAVFDQKKEIGDERYRMQTQINSLPDQEREALDNAVCRRIIQAVERFRVSSTQQGQRTKEVKHNVKNLLMSATPANTTIFHLACKHGFTFVVKEMIKLGADLSARDVEGQSPVHKAASEGHLHVMEVLYAHAQEEHSDIWGRKDGAGWTPLHSAVAAGRVPMVEWLLRHGADPNASDTQGQSPLHLAAHVAHNGGECEISTLLVRRGAHLWGTDKEGATPLARAAARLKIELVRQYLNTWGVWLNEEQLLLVLRQVPKRKQHRVADLLRECLQAQVDRLASIGEKSREAEALAEEQEHSQSLSRTSTGQLTPQASANNLFPSTPSGGLVRNISSGSAGAGGHTPTRRNSNTRNNSGNKAEDEVAVVSLGSFLGQGDEFGTPVVKGVGAPASRTNSGTSSSPKMLPLSITRSVSEDIHLHSSPPVQYNSHIDPLGGLLARPINVHHPKPPLPVKPQHKSPPPLAPKVPFRKHMEALLAPPSTGGGTAGGQTGASSPADSPLPSPPPSLTVSPTQSPSPPTVAGGGAGEVGLHASSSSPFLSAVVAHAEPDVAPLFSQERLAARIASGLSSASSSSSSAGVAPLYPAPLSPPSHPINIHVDPPSPDDSSPTAADAAAAIAASALLAPTPPASPSAEQ